MKKKSDLALKSWCSYDGMQSFWEKIIKHDKTVQNDYFSEAVSKFLYQKCLCKWPIPVQ